MRVGGAILTRDMGIPGLEGLLAKEGSQQWNLYRILIPPLIAIAFFILCLLLLPRETILILGGLMIAYYVPPAGKESIIPLGIGLGIPWWLMALTLTLLDVITSLFVIMNFALMRQIPRLGPWIEKTADIGREFMGEHPWIARWRIPGVAFFVFLPLQGTGGVGATVVGMMAGLTPGEILIAVVIGAAVESLLFAIGSELIWQVIMANLAIGIALAVGTVMLLISLIVLFNRRYSQKREVEKGQL